MLQALRFHQLTAGVQLQQPGAQFIANLIDRRMHSFPGRHVVRGGIDGEARHLAHHFAGERIKKAQTLDPVVEQLHPHRFALGFRRKNIDDIAAHPIGTLLQINFVAGVLHVGQAPQQFALIENVAARHVQYHAQVRVRITQTVNGGDSRHDDRVRPLQQRLGG